MISLRIIGMLFLVVFTVLDAFILVSIVKLFSEDDWMGRYTRLLKNLTIALLSITTLASVLTILYLAAKYSNLI